MCAWTCRHTDGKVVQKIVPPRPRIPWWKGPVCRFRRSKNAASDINTALADSLKELTPKSRLEKRTSELTFSTTKATFIFFTMCARTHAELPKRGYNGPMAETLTTEEFASLLAVGNTGVNGPAPAIPAEHAALLDDARLHGRFGGQVADDHAGTDPDICWATR